MKVKVLRDFQYSEKYILVELAIQVSRRQDEYRESNWIDRRTIEQSKRRD
jgi:hypothetical protein